MKRITYLIRLSAKYSFLHFREKSPLWCASLSTYIFVTSKFYNHITSNHKRRKIRDSLERLLIIPLLTEVILQGNLAEQRYMKKQVYYKITKLYHKKSISVIIVKNKERNYLVSCFVK